MKLANMKMLIEGIRLAEKLAERECRLERLIEQKAPEVIIDHARRLLVKGEEAVQQDIVAQKMLPQARAVVRAEIAREEAIKRTAFGQLFEAVKERSGGCDLTSFSNAGDKRLWKRFCKALKVGSEQRALDVLYELLVSAKVDLLYTELPPKLGYHFREKVYSKSEIN